MDTFELTIPDRIVFMTMLSAVAAAASLMAYKSNFYTFPQPVKKDLSLNLRDVCFAFIIFLVIQAVILPTLGRFWEIYNVNARGWSPIFGIGLTIAGILGYFQMFSKEALQDVWNHGEPKGFVKNVKNFLFGVMTWTITYPIVAALGQALALALYFFFDKPELDQAPVKALKQTMQNPLLFTFMAGAIILLVPVIEEMLFRGILQTWLKQYFGIFGAIGFTSLVFAAFHYSPEQGLSNVEFLIALFVLSCYLGFIYERQRSLWASIGLHSAFNAISVVMIIF